MKRIYRAGDTRETNVERYLRDQVRKLGGLCIKFVSPGFKGVMDRICLIPGGVIGFVETKSKTGKLSPRQKIVKKQFEELGFKVYILNTKDKVNQFYELHRRTLSGIRD